MAIDKNREMGKLDTMQNKTVWLGTECAVVSRNDNDSSPIGTTQECVNCESETCTAIVIKKDCFMYRVLCEYHGSKEMVVAVIRDSITATLRLMESTLALMEQMLEDL